MSNSRSAFRCKTTGCYTVLGYVTNRCRLKVTAGEAAISDSGLMVVCPACGALRQWREIDGCQAA